MQWEFIVALVLAIPVILLPVVLIQYLNIAGIGRVIMEPWRGRDAREQGIGAVVNKQPPGIEAIGQQPHLGRVLDNALLGGEDMTTLGRVVAMPELDVEGYMLRPQMWTEDVAEFLAQELVPGGLTEEHWRVIHYLRGYYLEFGIAPPVSKLCRETGLSLKYIYKLFPGNLPRGLGAGLARCACKIAGIPWMSFKQYP